MSSKPYCRSYTVASLEEYLEVIGLLNDSMVKSSQELRYSPIWYRGHERQEILQHHLGTTRLMDWSESAISALMVALEAFIDPRDNKELEYRRLNMTPTVWVLAPLRLNRHIYRILKDNRGLVNAAVQDIEPEIVRKRQLVNQIYAQLQTGQDTYFENHDKMSMNGIFCLSAIESERQSRGNRMKYLLRNEEFNPFFYLLLRYYNDGLPLPMETLPPLAIVHPYHSRRIQSQHGVFTVMPHYKIGETVVGSIYDKRPMERQM